MAAGNWAAAHQLFVNHIAHCYITGPLSVLNHSANRVNLRAKLTKLSEKDGPIPNWSSQGQLLKRVLDSFAESGQVRYPESLARDLDYFSSHGNDSARYLQKAIWSLLLQVSAKNSLDKVLSELH